MSYKSALLSFFSVLIIFSLGHFTYASDSDEAQRYYRNNDMGFEMDIPKEWVDLGPKVLGEKESPHAVQFYLVSKSPIDVFEIFSVDEKMALRIAEDKSIKLLDIVGGDGRRLAVKFNFENDKSTVFYGGNEVKVSDLRHAFLDSTKTIVPKKKIVPDYKNGEEQAEGLEVFRVGDRVFVRFVRHRSIVMCGLDPDGITISNPKNWPTTLEYVETKDECRQWERANGNQVQDLKSGALEREYEQLWYQCNGEYDKTTSDDEPLLSDTEKTRITELSKNPCLFEPPSVCSDDPQTEWKDVAVGPSLVVEAEVSATISSSYWPKRKLSSSKSWSGIFNLKFRNGKVESVREEYRP